MSQSIDVNPLQCLFKKLHTLSTSEHLLLRVMHLLLGHTLPKSITHTNLVLLPKKERVQSFTNMRPISLSNFLNNVISRIIHNKLEILLPSIISQNLYGFVKGRSITENVLLAQEIITDIRKRGKPTNVVIKLDMAKAYGRVSWHFLINVLHKLGFDKLFVDKIWRLMSNNWYSVLINGQPTSFSILLEVWNKGTLYLQLCSFFLQKFYLEPWMLYSLMRILKVMVWFNGVLIWII